MRIYLLFVTLAVLSAVLLPTEAKKNDEDKKDKKDKDFCDWSDLGDTCENADDQCKRGKANGKGNGKGKGQGNGETNRKENANENAAFMQPSEATVTDIQIGEECAAGDNACCGGLLMENEFSESFIEPESNTASPCSAPVNLPNCELTSDQQAAIKEHAQATDKLFSEVVKEFLADSRIGISTDELSPTLFECLDCSDQNDDCRYCLRRKKLLGSLLKCNNGDPAQLALRKNAAWNLCSAKQSHVKCEEDYSCNDASRASCADVEFCEYIDDVVRPQCSQSEHISPEDLQCVAYTCGGRCSSKYLFKGESYELNETLAAAGDSCPLVGLVQESGTKPGMALNDSLVDIYCSAMNDKRMMKKRCHATAGTKKTGGVYGDESDAIEGRRWGSGR